MATCLTGLPGPAIFSYVAGWRNAVSFTEPVESGVPIPTLPQIMALLEVKTLLLIPLPQLFFSTGPVIYVVK